MFPESPMTDFGIGRVPRIRVGQANKLASVAHHNLALAVGPAHTTHDGDTMFALASATSDGVDADLDRLGAATVVCVGRAIVRGVRMATGLAGVRAALEP